MGKNFKNARKQWTTAQEALLKKLIKGNTPTRIIALKEQRSEESIRSKASALGLSLKPTNQSPYGTKKKK